MSNDKPQTQPTPAETAEQKHLKTLLNYESNRGGSDGMDAPQGWIGPIEANRRAEKIRELREDAKRLRAALAALAETFHARPDMLALCGFQEHAQIKAAYDALNAGRLSDVK